LCDFNSSFGSTVSLADVIRAELMLPFLSVLALNA
jgi:hypothetical protein